ncbi:MAG: glycosyltransferase [Planctomycetes bacterium]|nr:glycosyltransferase [Planctomycetota bacterium]
MVRGRIVYPAHSPARVREEAAFAASLAQLRGDDVQAVGVTCPDGWWDFPRLDAAWRQRDAGLLRAFDQLGDELAGADIVLASGGAMLHPRFLEQLSAATVLVCGDDPENSDRLSRPVAPHFDVAFTTNVACVADYRRWGCRRADWLFPPLRAADLAAAGPVPEVLERPRDLDAVMLCERVFGLSDRAQRVERLVAAVPTAFIAGRGWPRGFVDDTTMQALFRRGKIGWNLHNSLGPCNVRLTQLPAYGVLQICDNKSHLGEVFALGDEVVGFDTIDECIEATRYYLVHDDERRKIAARGCQRVRTDYTEAKWWQRILDAVADVSPRTDARELQRA